ncbi:MAG: M20 family metallopeptidase [Lachnospiraceae bacterium]|nr:M20 family metallopeptidase [Lachnospiraceae bacterium]
MEQRILSYLKEHEAEIFEDLKTLALAEASTSDIEALSECRRVLERLILERTGCEPYTYKAEKRHDLVRFEYGEGTEKVLLIGHYDTVHPIGTLKYYTEGNELHGPGVMDMKSGLISAIWIVKAYRELKIDPGKRLVFIFNGDEETGSRESEAIICELAKDAKAALVCEPCVANGDLKTGRKGTMNFDVIIHGKAAHAGNAHKVGINAIQEMAEEILFVQSLTDYEAGTTLNVGVCGGGTKVNVIPDRAEYEVDCRYQTKAEGERVRKAICELEVKIPGTVREVLFKDGKPPMEQTPENLALFAIAKECGKRLGLSFSHQFVGGGSDGNAVSAMGIPTLDGLGAWGDYAHSPNEYLRIDQYVLRIALLGLLVIEI